MADRLCEYCKTQTFLTCSECKSSFCNGVGVNTASHVVFHLGQRHHKRLSFNGIPLKCYKCLNDIIFDLGISSEFFCTLKSSGNMNEHLGGFGSGLTESVKGLGVGKCFSADLENTEKKLPNNYENHLGDNQIYSKAGDVVRFGLNRQQDIIENQTSTNTRQNFNQKENLLNCLDQFCYEGSTVSQKSNSSSNSSRKLMNTEINILKTNEAVSQIKIEGCEIPSDIELEMNSCRLIPKSSLLDNQKLIECLSKIICMNCCKDSTWRPLVHERCMVPQLFSSFTSKLYQSDLISLEKTTKSIKFANQLSYSLSEYQNLFRELVELECAAEKSLKESMGRSDVHVEFFEDINVSNDQALAAEYLKSFGLNATVDAKKQVRALYCSFSMPGIDSRSCVGDELLIQQSDLFVRAYIVGNCSNSDMIRARCFKGNCLILKNGQYNISFVYKGVGRTRMLFGLKRLPKLCPILLNAILGTDCSQKNEKKNTEKVKLNQKNTELESDIDRNKNPSQSEFILTDKALNYPEFKKSENNGPGNCIYPINDSIEGHKILKKSSKDPYNAPLEQESSSLLDSKDFETVEISENHDCSNSQHLFHNERLPSRHSILDRNSLFNPRLSIWKGLSCNHTAIKGTIDPIFMNNTGLTKISVPSYFHPQDHRKSDLFSKTAYIGSDSLRENNSEGFCKDKNRWDQNRSIGDNSGHIYSMQNITCTQQNSSDVIHEPYRTNIPSKDCLIESQNSGSTPVHKTLQTVLNFPNMASSSNNRDYDYPFIIPSSETLEKIVNPPSIPLLNASQKAAVAAALERPLTLIQGPPGTGKTVTSAAVVYNHCLRGEKVLVVSGGNTGVDNLARKLHETGLRIVRIVSKRREGIEDDLSFLSLHIQAKALLGEARKNKHKNRSFNPKNHQKFMHQNIHRHQPLQNCKNLKSHSISLNDSIKKNSVDFENPQNQGLHSTIQGHVDSLGKSSLRQKHMGKKRTRNRSQKNISQSQSEDSNFSQSTNNSDFDLNKYKEACKNKIEFRTCDKNFKIGQSSIVFSEYSSPKDTRKVQMCSSFIDPKSKPTNMKKNNSQATKISKTAEPDSNMADSMKINQKNDSEDSMEESARHSAMRKILSHAQVVACTCVTAGHWILRNATFTTVLIDEAVQCTEPLSTIPLAYKCKKLILVGDHKQLRPIIHDKHAAQNGLKQSMFERLVKLGHTPFLLNLQYRMHPRLAEWPSNAFYNGSLKTGIQESKRSLKMCLPLPTFLYASYGPEEISKSGTSYLNQSEALLVTTVVKMLIKNCVKPHQIGIITPYEGQRAHLTQKLSLQMNIDDLEIRNVDAFQGREKDFIIVSLVRSNKNQIIGFLSDKRRLNVTLTRGKYACIIIGNPFTLGRDKTWNDLIKFYQNRDLIFKGPIEALQKHEVMQKSTGIDLRALFDKISF